MLMENLYTGSGSALTKNGWASMSRLGHGFAYVGLALLVVKLADTVLDLIDKRQDKRKGGG